MPVNNIEGNYQTRDLTYFAIQGNLVFLFHFQHKEELVGHNCNIYLVNLTAGFTRQELVNFLIDKGLYYSM